MITSRALLFGFIGGCFYLIAIVNSLPPLFFALMWLTAGILVSCFGIALLSLYGLRASWRLESSGVSQTSWGMRRVRTDDSDDLPPAAPSSSGPPARPEEEIAGAGIALEVGNAGTFNKSDIVIEVRLRALPSVHDEDAPAAVRTSRLSRLRRAPGEPVLVRRFLVEALPSRARLLTFLPLHDLERGRYTVEQVQAVGSDVLGLFRPRKRLALAVSPGEDASREPEESEPVIVGPRIVRLGRGSGAPALASGSGGSGTTSVAGRSDEFGGTRPYVAGDDLRFVHWKSTARRGEMVVREWERATLRRSLVLWDGSAFAPPTDWAQRHAQGRAEGDARGASGPGASPASTWGARRRARLGRSGAAPGSELEQAWTRGVEWSLEIALSLANALSTSGEPCSLWRLDSRPQHAEIVGAASLARGAELLADARAQRAAPLTEALRGALTSQKRSEGATDARTFLIALAPTPALMASARQLRGATVVLIDISRLQAPRMERAQLAVWRKSLREAEAQMQEAGLRVIRLPVAHDEATPEPSAQSDPDWDEWTREALRALLDSRAGTASGAARSSLRRQRQAQVLAAPAE